jgi:hypothetical protein
VWSAASTVTVVPAWTMPTWMRCPANGQRAAAADAPFDADGCGCRLRGWAGGAGIADAGDLSGGERVGQAAHQDTVVDELEQAAIETHRQAPAGELEADGVLAAGEADQAGGVDGPVDFDRVARITDGDRRWAGRVGAFVE